MEVHDYRSAIRNLSERMVARLDVQDLGREVVRALHDCLAKLPERQRTLVQEAYVPGVRIDEMAREAGRTPMSLYKTLHRIRMALADCIQDHLKREEGSA